MFKRVVSLLRSLRLVVIALAINIPLLRSETSLNAAPPLRGFVVSFILHDFLGSFSPHAQRISYAVDIVEPRRD